MVGSLGFRVELRDYCRAELRLCLGQDHSFDVPATWPSRAFARTNVSLIGSE